jgi:hypothetical protein
MGMKVLCAAFQRLSRCSRQKMRRAYFTSSACLALCSTACAKKTFRNAAWQAVLLAPMYPTIHRYEYSVRRDIDRPRMRCLDMTSVAVILLLDVFCGGYFVTLQKSTLLMERSERDHSSPSSSMIKSTWIIPPLLHTSL